MNKLVAAVALTTFIASPAFGQSFDPHIGSGNIVQPTPLRAGNSTRHPAGSAAFAQASERQRVKPLTGAERAAFERSGRLVPPGGTRAFAQSLPRAIASREQALRECNDTVKGYAQNTWGDTQLHMYRTCMHQRGHME